ncbi:MAG: hypothetical protein AAB822_00325 [Patescibacteria group bacterium]
MSKFKQSFLTIAIGLALIAGISYAWTGPTANPPANNAPAPINVSSIGQYKTGALGIGGLFRAYTNAIVDGNIGIGTEAPKNRLHIKGSNWPALFVDSSDAKGGFIGYGNNTKTGWATGMEGDGTWRVESYVGNGDWRGEWSNGWVTGINVITAQKDGKVGLGTVAPQATLHIATPNGENDPWAFRMDQGAGVGKVLTSDASGNARWAPMANSVLPQGTLCGSAFYEIAENSNYCWNLQQVASCSGKPIMTQCGVTVCPNGFSPVRISYSWGEGSGYDGGTYRYYGMSCSKI